MTTENSPLSGATAAITGSSSGIGRAIAVRLARGGAACLIHGRANRAGAEQTAAEVRAAGGAALVVMADLAEPSERERFFAAAWDWRGTVDIWINAAGADVLTGEAAAWSFAEKLAQLWRVDVEATIHLSRLCGAAMLVRRGCEKKGTGSEQASQKSEVSCDRDVPVPFFSQPRRGGVILNVGWDQAQTGMAGDSGEMFAAVKGAVMAFSKSLARSLAPQVRVNCLAPGWIKTAWGQQASDDWQRRAVGESLLSRWGTPEDVAEAAFFLASSTAAFITGQTINVNGGHREADVG